MSEVHAQARTTPRTRTEIKEATGTLVELAERYNISKATARKWKNRESPEDLGECQGSCRLIHATLADSFSGLGAKFTG